jgi:hypothetical protein
MELGEGELAGPVDGDDEVEASPARSSRRRRRAAFLVVRQKRLKPLSESRFLARRLVLWHKSKLVLRHKNNMPNEKSNLQSDSKATRAPE